MKPSIIIQYIIVKNSHARKIVVEWPVWNSPFVTTSGNGINKGHLSIYSFAPKCNANNNKDEAKVYRKKYFISFA